mmetsp:Transcript_25156/g.55164  ORF Transcript_25156/g.55164 Transcript_25156/m.55164 type:complete len:253 (+) Transcript_25156:1140-1898(+)
MERGQNLAFYSIFNGVDHGHFRQNSGSFFFQSRSLGSGLHNIHESVQCHGKHWHVPTGCFHRTDCIKYGVMEIGIGIGLRPSSKKKFTLSRSHVGYVFREMGNSLLRFKLIGRTRKDLQVGLEASRWTLVRQNNVRESIRKCSAANIGVDGQGIRWQFVLRIGSKTIQGRNVGPNTGVRRQLSSEGRRPVVVLAVAGKHVAKKVALLVVLFVQCCRFRHRSLHRRLLLLLNTDRARSLHRCGERRHGCRRPA